MLRLQAEHGAPTLQMNRQVGRSSIELSQSVECVNVDVSAPTAEAMPTWDIEVEGTGNFVSQGFIVHNSKLTMKYPAVWLMEPHARGEVLSVAFSGDGQHQDAGGKVVHVAPHTSSQIVSKSISKGTGRSSYRGLLKVHKGANDVRSNVRCDALLLDETSRTDTYPYIEIEEDDVRSATRRPSRRSARAALLPDEPRAEQAGLRGVVSGTSADRQGSCRWSTPSS
jgi:Fe-S cluster assembly scaffold protein SufB